MNISDIAVDFHEVRWKTIFGHRIIFQLRQHGRAFGEGLFQGEAELQGGPLFPGVYLKKKYLAVVVDQVIATEDATISFPAEHLADLYGVIVEFRALLIVDR